MIEQVPSCFRRSQNQYEALWLLKHFLYCLNHLNLRFEILDCHMTQHHLSCHYREYKPCVLIIGHLHFIKKAICLMNNTIHKHLSWLKLLVSFVDYKILTSKMVKIQALSYIKHINKSCDCGWSNEMVVMKAGYWAMLFMGIECRCVMGVWVEYLWSCNSSFCWLRKSVLRLFSCSRWILV